jgi:hypothetical protein
MRITAFDPILAASLTANDVILIESLGLGLTKKLSLTNLATYLFGGTLTTGAFVTLTGTMTLENKRLNNPRINSASTTAVTSAELSILHGATITTAELNLLAGKTSVVDLASVQTILNKTLQVVKLSGWYINNGTSWVEATIKAEELNFLSGLNENLYAWMTNIENRLEDVEASDERLFTLEFGAGGATHDITEASIQTALSTTKKVHIASQIWFGDNDGSSKITIEPSSNIKVCYQTTLGTVHLDKYTLTTTSGHDYFVSIKCILI